MDSMKQRLLEPETTCNVIHLDRRHTALLFLSDGKLAAGDEQGNIYIHDVSPEEKHDNLPLLLKDKAQRPVRGLTYPVCQLLQRSSTHLVSCHQSKSGSADHSIMHFAQWNLKTHEMTYLGSAKDVSQIEVSGLEKLVGITRATQRALIFTSQAKAPDKNFGEFLSYTLESVPVTGTLRAKALLSENDLLVANSDKLFKWNKQKENSVPEMLYGFDMRQEEMMIVVHSRTEITPDSKENLQESKVTRAAIGMSNGNIHIIDPNNKDKPAFVITFDTIPVKDRHLSSLAWLPNGDLICVHNKKYFGVLHVEKKVMVLAKIGSGFEQMTVSRQGQLSCLTNDGKEIHHYTFPRVRQYLAELARDKNVLKAQSTSSYSFRKFAQNGKHLLINDSPTQPTYPILGSSSGGLKK